MAGDVTWSRDVTAYCYTVLLLLIQLSHAQTLFSRATNTLRFVSKLVLSSYYYYYYYYYYWIVIQLSHAQNLFSRATNTLRFVPKLVLGSYYAALRQHVPKNV